MSTTWFLVSTYLIWILGSKWILSINQSSATLWIRDNFIVFINVQLRLTLRGVCVCGNVVHMRQLINISGFPIVWGWICVSANSFLLRDWLVVWYCSMNVTLLSPRPIKSRASNPSIRSPASNEMISDWVKLWDTDVCFSYIQLIGTNV